MTEHFDILFTSLKFELLIPISFTHSANNKKQDLVPDVSQTFFFRRNFAKMFAAFALYSGVD